MENVIKVNPSEFGLNDTQVQTIEQAFLPKIQERDGLAEIYQQVLTKELTHDLCSEAKQIRLKLVKVRTGIAEIHKTQKAYFLSAGRFVDAWKNKETLPIEQMEENLYKIENHFINIEKERIAKLEADRIAVLSQYSNIIPQQLGTMQDDVFTAYLLAQKKSFEDRMEAEKQAEIDKIAREKAEAEERERIKRENEKLKAEADAREKAIQEERKKQADILANERAKAVAKQKAIEEAARIEREKQAAIIAKQQAELKAKKDAEDKAKEDADRIERERITNEKAAAKAPDKTKLINFINSIQLPVLPDLQSDESKQTANLIAEKFESFKKWAVLQIDNI